MAGASRFTFGIVIFVLAVYFVDSSFASSQLIFHQLSKHSFTGLSKCGGDYDMAIYARMNQICQDCYNLYRDPEIFRGCRKDCFTTDYFDGCLTTLRKTDDKAKIKEDLSIIHPQLDQ